jgi:hypothetical protein
MPLGAHACERVDKPRGEFFHTNMVSVKTRAHSDHRWFRRAGESFLC